MEVEVFVGPGFSWLSLGDFFVPWPVVGETNFHCEAYLRPRQGPPSQAPPGSDPRSSPSWSPRSRRCRSDGLQGLEVMAAACIVHSASKLQVCRAMKSMDWI